MSEIPDKPNDPGVEIKALVASDAFANLQDAGHRLGLSWDQTLDAMVCLAVTVLGQAEIGDSVFLCKPATDRRMRHVADLMFQNGRMLCYKTR